MPKDMLPIEAFIQARLVELGLNDEDFLHRLGYRKLRKGRGHLEQIYNGDFDRRILVQRLPRALDVSPGALRRVAEETGRHLRAVEEAAYRATFSPHAVVLTDRLRPEPLFVVAFIGVDRLLRIELDLDLPPATFAHQALEGLTGKLLGFNARLREADLAPEAIRRQAMLPAFGRPTGFVINYTPVHAVRHDLDGNPVETLDRAKRLGSPRYIMSGRPLSEAELSALFGHVE
jgi:hypothetical protein